MAYSIIKDFKRNKFVFILIFILNLNYILINTGIVNNRFVLLDRIFLFSVLLLCVLYKLNNKKYKIEKYDLFILMLGVIPLLNFEFYPFILNYYYIFAIVFVLRNYEKTTIINASLLSMTIGILMVFVLLYLGGIHNSLDIVGSRVRYTFGFSNVNALSTYIYSILLLFLNKNAKIKRIPLFVTLIINIIAFYYLDTRSMLYGYIMFLVSYYYFCFFTKNDKKNHRFLFVIYIFLIILPLFLSINPTYLRESFPTLDILLSMRLTIFSNYIRRHSVLNILIGGSTITAIDNGYLTLLFSFGILILLCFYCLIIYSGNKFLKNHNIIELSTILSVLYYNLVESSFISPEILLTVLFYYILFRNSKNRN